MKRLAQWDHRFVWHPFTQMRDWLRREPRIIVSGKGAVLRDAAGREYLDANSSIWTNLHGHQHPKINAAIQRQLGKIAHSSSLGLGNEPASILAKRLVTAGNRSTATREASRSLQKVFYSDDGSTAIEAALKMAYAYTRRMDGVSRPRFLAIENGYHGDTVGAVSLGQSPVFHREFSGLRFKVDSVMAPYCYRCPFNRAKPERIAATTSRKCGWECVQKVEGVFENRARHVARGAPPYAGFIYEPLIQGAAGMIVQPEGWLRRVTDIARAHRTLLMADEVMTGFGRTGSLRSANGRTHSLFASGLAGVQPDFLCLAKGLTGGYLPMAATLTTQTIFDAFLGDLHEGKTFYHGHSYTGNQLGAAASIASLDLLESSTGIRARKRLEHSFAEALSALWTCAYVGDIRQIG